MHEFTKRAWLLYSGLRKRRICRDATDAAPGQRRGARIFPAFAMSHSARQAPKTPKDAGEIFGQLTQEET
jgi:hypothetical protein